VSDSVVAVDAMGGDHAPAAVVAGAVQAARRRGLKIILTGPESSLRAELDAAGGSGLGIVIVDAPQSVGMDESPLTAHRRKPGSSVRVAAALVARGDASALFSAGHTGATFLAARAAFGLSHGVNGRRWPSRCRPAAARRFCSMRAPISNACRNICFSLP